VRKINDPFFSFYLASRWQGTPEVLVTEVTRKDEPVTEKWVAMLDGFVNASISALVSGHLISQNYKERTAVKNGDLLFQIDPRPFEEALIQAKGTLAKDEAARIKAEEDGKRELDLFKPNLDVHVRLVADLPNRNVRSTLLKVGPK
jgi:multidrug efflux pump subunit AcrA (membrane-fusion protein)